MSHRLLAAAVSAALSAATLAACSPTDIAESAPRAAAGPMTQAKSAITALDQLPVKGRAPKTGYSRDQFGPAWSDSGSTPGSHNGCSGRDILAAP